MSVTHRPLRVADLVPDGPLRRLGRQVLLAETLDSTNRFLLERAADLADGAVAHAEFQSAGRGRLGRTWHAPRGAALLLSVLLQEPVGSPLQGLAGLLACVATCEAVEATTDVAVRVRWPNDLYVDQRKLGGVLAESRLLSVRRRALVIGIGLNCLQHVGHFPPELRATATSLELATSRAVDRAAVAAALLRSLDGWLERGRTATGYDRLRRAWQARCADVGTRVTLVHDGRTYAGTALDIDASGDLIVQLDRGGRRHFVASNTTRIG